MKSISTPLPLSSGDPVVDRRLEWARGLLEKGEAKAAAELLRETLEERPGFLAGQFLLGEASEQAGEIAAATAAYRNAIELDPEDRLGANLRLAQLGGRFPAMAMSPAYLRNLFDQYASRFDRELVKALSYRGPELLRDALEKIAPGRTFERVLDLGCGTGLMGEAIRDRAGDLTGVDISPAMVEAARRKNIYHQLEVAEFHEFIDRQTGKFDLVLAADVFVYLGNLAPILKSLVGVASGLIAFTTETHPGSDVVLLQTLRFAHSEKHIRDAAAENGFQVLLLEKASTRTEKGKPVESLLAVLSPAGR
jgi:predicted TPR repeat methyltransferase